MCLILTENVIISALNNQNIYLPFLSESLIALDRQNGLSTAMDAWSLQKSDRNNTICCFKKQHNLFNQTKQVLPLVPHSNGA